MVYNVAERLFRVLHAFHSRENLACALLEHRSNLHDVARHRSDRIADLNGRLLSLIRQLANFARNDGKPRPCSPARAASIAALSANRFVWLATSEI